MATKQLLLPGELVKKHNELVRSKINIDSVAGSRILASLISCIKTNDADLSDTYSIQIKNLLPNDSGKSYQEIKNSCRELIKSNVEIEYKDAPMPDGSTEDIFIAIPFLSYIQYRKGTINARFNKEMESFLLGLKQHFTQYNLLEYLTLPTAYSQRLFEYLKSWSSKPEHLANLSELFHTLNTPESMRVNFAEFRRRVLEKAQKDINGKTSLSFDWEPVKQGRAVVAIRFIFAKGKAALITQAKVSDKQQKNSQKANKTFLDAVACAKRKDGHCPTPDNKHQVCKFCRTYNILDERG